jgi:hypothetical protein
MCSNTNSSERIKALTVAQVALAILCLMITGNGLAVHGQTVSGTIVGTVSDEKGASLPNAAVTVINIQTNQSRNTITDVEGNYTFSNLSLGQYEISVESQGFKKGLRSNIKLSVDQTLRIDFNLMVGDITEVLMVRGEAPQVRSETSELGEVINREQVNDLPLNGRNFVQLVTLTTGTATGVPGQTLKGNSTIGFRSDTAVTSQSGRAAENNFLLDGVDNNEADLGSIVIIPIVDGIQEFKVLSNAFSAEYGRTNGVIISVQTRSGTNQWHGSLFEFFRNSALDAKNFFDFPDRKIPLLIQNQFGGTLSLPIIKARTFFFGDYQGTRLRQAQTFLTTVPTQALREGDFSGTGLTIRDPLTGLPFIGNIIPASAIDPAAAALVKTYPLPNRPSSVNNFINNPILTRRDDQFDSRLDHRFTARSNFFIRYSFNDTTRYLPSQLSATTAPAGGDSATITGAGNASLRTQGIAVNHTFILSPNLINETVLGVTRFALTNTPEGFGENLADEFGIPGINISETSSGLTRIIITGFAGLGPSAFLPNFSTQNMFQLQNNLSWSRGAHTLRLGGDFRRRQRSGYSTFFQQGQFVFNPTFTGHSLASFLTGYPTTTVRTILDAPFDRRSWELAAYVQDDINVNRRLKLNLGIRYEVWSPVVEAHDRQANFDTTTGRMILAGEVQPPGRGLRRFDLNNFGPRFGFAYDLFGSARTILRAGFGITFLEDGGQVVQLNLADNYPFSFTQAISTFGRPLNRLSQGLLPPAITNPLVPSGNIKYIDPNFQAAYTQMWHFDIQQQLTENLLLDVAYAGSQAVRLRTSKNINQPMIGTGPANSRRPFFRLNPALGDVIGTFSDGQANYHSLQVKLNKRFSGGLAFFTSYTFSKTITNHEGIAANSCDTTFGANPADQRSDRSVACIDIPHRFVFSYNYELPFGKRLKGIGGVFGRGWQINGIALLRSGSPFTPQLAVTSPVNGATVRPDLLCSGALTKSERTVQRYFDVGCFRIPDNSKVYGNAGRNLLRGPGQVNFDFSVFKKFELSEAVTLQFRMEIFNLFNTPQLGMPVRFIDTPEAGSIQNTVNTSRQIQFALKLYF